ncbi:MAG: TIGR01459 family HAD-type hydrolase, partial [Xanthobacteraceae bacterium]
TLDRAPASANGVPLTEHFAPLARDYDVLFCDVWGVIHNGLAAFADACKALARFRAGGGSAVLITNAPRPGDAVQRILDRLGVPRDAYDAIVSSGDVTRSVVEARLSQSVFHLGPQRDLPIFAGLDVRFAPAEVADYVVCSGLFDDTVETPDSYRDLLGLLRARSSFMVCANPDIVVERGATLVYCAGALADAYAALGGEVLYCGKPHAPIYEAALARAAALRGGMPPPPLARVLAIGDSVRTDLIGAASFGLDCVFVTSALHAEQYGSREAPDVAALNAMFKAAGVAPKAILRGLDW